jgi:putative salt-induced outer membrane protein YdiY
MPTLRFLGLGSILILTAAAPAAAQPAPPEQHVEDVAAETPVEHVTKWDVSLGGILQTGNTESYSVQGASLFELVRGRHGFTAEAQGSYGAAQVDEATPEYEDTTRTVRLRLRYDFFLTDLDAIFLAGLFRHDPFAGLDYRLQGQVGYARYIFREENHRLWGELGYDLTYDNYDPDPLIDPDTMMMLDGTAVVHSARIFTGYENAKDENLQFRTGVEVLINLERASDVRVSWDTSLRSKLVGRLQVELKFLLQLDTEPVPGNERLDTTTQLNLLYNLI